MKQIELHKRASVGLPLRVVDFVAALVEAGLAYLATVFGYIAGLQQRGRAHITESAGVAVSPSSKRDGLFTQIDAYAHRMHGPKSTRRTAPRRVACVAVCDDQVLAST
ncbi:hypothetical protein [Paraburkholderia terrae]